MTFHLDIACNNPNNGLFDFAAHQIMIGQAEFEPIGNPFGMVELPNKIRVSGKLWNIDASKEWVGNWCWNRYVLSSIGCDTPLDAVGTFLHWMRHRGKYQCTLAGADLYRWFNNRELKAYSHTVNHWIRQEYK